MDELRDLERRFDRLEARAASLVSEHGRSRTELARAEEFLALAPAVQERLERLSDELFGEALDEIQENLTRAIREILGQERTVASTREVKAGRLHVSFHIEQEGQVEDILHGQGGSVCNILSVGLRLVALSQLDPGRHRPFLVLDEQDCWLRPDLVPRFMGTIRKIADRMGFQVLIISHHPIDLFATKAQRIYGLKASRESGVAVEVIRDGTEPDTFAELETPPPEAAGGPDEDVD
jgi:DNA repair exonuclease SbcCD ATPase subunit